MQHLQKTRGRVDIRWKYVPASTPTLPLSLSLGPRSSIQSIRKCQIQPHSTRRDIAPCARDPQMVAAEIHQAPNSLPAPCRQPHIRSKEAALLAQLDSQSPTQREPSPSRVQIAPQQSASPLPASLWALPGTPSRAAPVPLPPPPAPRQAACSSGFPGAAHKSARLAPRTRIPRSENELRSAIRWALEIPPVANPAVKLRAMFRRQSNIPHPQQSRIERTTARDIARVCENLAARTERRPAATRLRMTPRERRWKEKKKLSRAPPHRK